MQTEQLTVTGMTCGGCVTKVTHALKAVTGVGGVKVSLASGEAAVQYDERLLSRPIEIRGYRSRVWRERDQRPGRSPIKWGLLQLSGGG